MSAGAQTFSYTVPDRMHLITLHNHVDVHSIHALRERIRDVPAADARPVVLDMSAVTLMSTHALSALIASVRTVNRERARVTAVVCEHSPVTGVVADHAGPWRPCGMLRLSARRRA